MSVFDDLMKHKIFLQRLGKGEAKRLYQDIVKISQRLQKELRNRDDIKLRELNRLTNTLKEELAAVMVSASIKRLKNFSEYEANFNYRLLNRVKELKDRLKPINQKAIDRLFDTKSLKFSKDGKLMTVEQGLQGLVNVVGNDLNKAVKTAILLIGERKLSDIITDRLAEVTKGLLFRRAQVIAVTEVNHISAQTLRALYVENDNVIEKLRWDTMLDVYVCPDCEALEGQEWEVSEQSEEPPLHANCRCVLAPVTIFRENSKDTTELKQ